MESKDDQLDLFLIHIYNLAQVLFLFNLLQNFLTFTFFAMRRHYWAPAFRDFGRHKYMPIDVKLQQVPIYVGGSARGGLWVFEWGLLIGMNNVS